MGRSAVQRPYDQPRRAHGSGRSAANPRAARTAHALGPAPAPSPPARAMDRTDRRKCGVARLVAATHGEPCAWRRYLALACAGIFRRRAALRVGALVPARQLPSHGAAVLVGNPRLSSPTKRCRGFDCVAVRDGASYWTARRATDFLLQAVVSAVDGHGRMGADGARGSAACRYFHVDAGWPDLCGPGARARRAMDILFTIAKGARQCGALGSPPRWLSSSQRRPMAAIGCGAAPRTEHGH